MKEWYAGMQFNGEVSIRCREKTFFRDTEHLAEEIDLHCSVADMFEDGVGIRDVELILCEGERASIGFSIRNFRIQRRENRPVFDADSGDILFVRIVFLEVVVGRGILSRIDTDIEDGIFWRWLALGDELCVFVFTTFRGNIRRNFFDPVHSCILMLILI